jgi:hypothetical protein
MAPSRNFTVRPVSVEAALDTANELNARHSPVNSRRLNAIMAFTLHSEWTVAVILLVAFRPAMLRQKWHRAGCGATACANGIPSKLFSDSCALPLEYSLHCLRSLIPIDL